MFSFFSGGSHEKHQQHSSALPLHAARALPQLHQVSRAGRQPLLKVNDASSIDACPQCLRQVQDRTAGLHQHHPGPHQSIPLQLLLPPLRGLAGRAEPPHPDAGDEGRRKIPGEDRNLCSWCDSHGTRLVFLSKVGDQPSACLCPSSVSLAAMVKCEI